MLLNGQMRKRALRRGVTLPEAAEPGGRGVRLWMGVQGAVPLLSHAHLSPMWVSEPSVILTIPHALGQLRQ